ncbi:MAG: DNA primase [Ruminococcaceae bacterium]|nr:DNA primase [Oscillospiraceae bacterium]
MALPDYFLQELKDRSDINDIISSYVNLKRRGKNLVGLCPFHNEKTGSFTVYPENGSFYCFGCHAGGDVITFIMKIENLDYIEAVKFLAGRAGLKMPEEGVDDSFSKLKTRVLEINRETARFYHSTLISEEGKKGLDYFLKRGLSMQTIRHFGLGYSPESKFALVNHLKKLKYTNDEMISANVALPTKSGNVIDRFYGRAMFPIIDLRGNVVAFGGRILTDQKPKYINTSDTPVYKKSQGLFAMNFAKNVQDGRLILAEGYMDVISLHAAGFTGAIASLGTSLTSEQAKIIARYAKEVVICYDSDEAGQKAAQRAIPILRETGLLVKVLAVPGNKDPDEFIRSNGKDGPARFRQLLEQSGNDIEYRLQKLKQGFDLKSNDGKVRYLTAACEVLSSLDNFIELEVYAGKLSEEIGVEKNAIIQQSKKLSAQRKRQRERKQIRDEVKMLHSEDAAVNPQKAKNPRIANAEEGIISYLFYNPDGIRSISEKLSPEEIHTDFGRRVYSFIINHNIIGKPLSLMDFTQEFSQQEMSAVSRILASRNDAKVTYRDAEEYISIIKNETAFIEADQILKADNEDINNYLKALRDKKK